MQRDIIYNKSCLSMMEVENESVALMVTSPPYNVGMEYEEILPWEKYLDFLFEVWRTAREKLIPGGRFAINVANVGRNPHIPFASHVVHQLLSLGMGSEGEIIWQKPIANSRGSCAWGSWRMPSNPVLEDQHEFILIFRKDRRKRNCSFLSEEQKQASLLSKEEFLSLRRSTWKINPAPKNGHPCPFPMELASRLIKLYSFVGDTVLDPFMGSGTAAVAAKELGRHFTGYEIFPSYCEIAYRRLRPELQKVAQP